MGRRIWVGVLVLLGGACSGGSGDEDAAVATSTTVVPSTAPAATTAAPTTTIPPTTTTVAETTTTLDPMEAARLEYFGASSDFNTRTAEIWSRYEDGGGVSEGEAQAYCAEMAPIEEQWAQQIAGYAWPETVRDEADALAKAAAGMAGTFYDCADETGRAAYEVLAAMPLDASSAEASAIRLALGLPIGR